MPKSKQPKPTTCNPADLQPHPRNAKLHDESQVLKIAESIQKFGFAAPIVTDGAGTILAGHGRWQAAINLQLSEVPIVEMGHLTETEQRAYMLADNRLSELGGGWDMEVLQAELDELQVEDVDLDALGFSAMDFPDGEEADLEKEWDEAGNPEYDGSPKGAGTIIIHFATTKSKQEFANAIGIKISDSAKFAWYPFKP